MPAGARSERTVSEQVAWAARHADPDVRALAEALQALEARVRQLEEAREGDGQ